MIFKEAKYYEKLSDGKVQCVLCPHQCILDEGEEGICKVRKNEDHALVSEVYGTVSSIGFDPIEKKPLYHFFPGSNILSVGSVGCNLKCNFCQNHQISQVSHRSIERETLHYLPIDVIRIAKNRKTNTSIAFTYNEPIVFYEYMFDVAKLAKEQAIHTVIVTNGFVNKEPLLELIPYMDAFSIDLKGFSESFYKKITKSALQPVLDTIKTIADHGKHMEITNLIIPTLNDNIDDFEKMVRWILETCGKDTVLHLSRYYPMYHSSIEPTPVETLLTLEKIAKKYLQYVYLGNISTEEGNITFCPQCSNKVISRSGYLVNKDGCNLQGECSTCGHKIFTYYS